MATPGSGRIAGQLPALYATVTWRVTIALYSCPGELYVPQSTKCPGVQRQPLGESMVVPIPGCDDLLLPLPEVVWPGIHHIWGLPTTISQHRAPATLHSNAWVHTPRQVIRYNSYEFYEADRGLSADRGKGHGRGAGPPLRRGGDRVPLPVRARCFEDAVPGGAPGAEGSHEGAVLATQHQDVGVGLVHVVEREEPRLFHLNRPP